MREQLVKDKDGVVRIKKIRATRITRKVVERILTHKQKKDFKDAQKETSLDAVNKKLAEKGLPIKFVASDKTVLKAAENFRKKVLADKSDKASQKAQEPAQETAIGPETTIDNGQWPDNKKMKELMAEAKERKIKYFRILHRNELLEILYSPGTTEGRIREIQDAAVARWKAGWSKKGE